MHVPRRTTGRLCTKTSAEDRENIVNKARSCITGPDKMNETREAVREGIDWKEEKEEKDEKERKTKIVR